MHTLYYITLQGGESEVGGQDLKTKKDTVITKLVKTKLSPEASMISLEWHVQARLDEVGGLDLKKSSPAPNKYATSYQGGES
jgi:hypothetical protein